MKKQRSYAVDALTHLMRAADAIRVLRRENARLREEVALLRARLAEQEKAA